MGADFDFLLGELVTDHGFGVRLSDLEGKDVRAEFYAEITAVEGVSGTITLPTGATLLTDSWQNSYEGVVTTVSTGKLPDEEFAREADGTLVTVDFLDNGDGTADYTLSGTPSPYPVAIVYEYSVAWIDYDREYDLNDLIQVVNGRDVIRSDSTPTPPSIGDIWLDTDSPVLGEVDTSRVTTSPYAVVDADEHIFVDTDGGAITVNLQAGVNGRNVRIINCGSSGNDVTVAPNGAELLTGANASRTLSDSSVIELTYETTEGWW